MSVVEPREGQGSPPDDPPLAPAAGPPEPPRAPATAQEKGDAGPGEGAIKKIVRNAASVLAGNALGEVLTTYAIVLAASTLGPAGFGRLSAAQAFMEPFDILASFGLGAIAIKVAAERGGADGVLRGTNLAIRAVTAPITVCIALGVAWSTGREALIPVLIVLCVNTLITPLSSSASLPFEFHQTMHRRIALPAIASVVRFFTAIAAARYLATPVGFQLSGLSSGLVMLLLGLLVARHYYPARLGFDRQLAVHLLRLAWPAAFLEFITMMYLRGSYIVLHGQGDVVLGEYAAADRFVKPVISIGSVFLASALPTIATLAHEKKFDVLLTNYRRAVVRMLVVMTPILAVTWLLSRVLLERYAPRYAGAVWPFRALSVSVIFVFLNNLSSVFIIALGQLRLITVVALINLGVYFGLAWALVPGLGATGAALATTVMEGINTIMQLSIVAVLLHRARARVRA